MPVINFQKVAKDMCFAAIMLSKALEEYEKDGSEYIDAVCWSS